MFDKNALRIQVGRSTLDRRAEAAEYLAQAEAAGNTKAARAWQKQVRAFDKLIADYGLPRYAS